MRRRRAQGVVKLLLEYGADVNAADPRGETALHKAIEHDHCEVVDILLDDPCRCLNRDAATRDGETALHFAVRFRHPHIVKKLVVTDTDINCIDKWGRTPAYVAKQTKQPKILEILLCMGGCMADDEVVLCDRCGAACVDPGGCRTVAASNSSVGYRE